MSYPSISAEALDQIGAARAEGQNPDITPAVRWIGPEPAVDLQPLSTASVELAEQLKAFGARPDKNDKDRFEGESSPSVFQALAHLPVEALDDPGFWRWVSVTELWWLAMWREIQSFRKGWESFRIYVDGKRFSECVALRMFLRGQLMTEAGDPSLAGAVSDGTDFWRSHILRVKTSYQPLVAAGLVRQQVASRMMVEELRDYAKRLNRLSSNVLLDMYDRAEAEALLRELRV